MYIEVEVKQGIIRGQEKYAAGFSNRKYYLFQGIPYAKAPIGSLRFKDPQEPELWSGVRDCLKEGNVAPQHNMLFGYPEGNEDCLYLNVYTPELPGNKNFSCMPVMVYVHGGGFTSGSGGTDLYGPDYLIEQSVVLVTFNYRLGVLGFLSLENSEVPGNAGLKDQVMALKWVQKNIEKFGGDPNNVTLFGESAGGASVQYHLLSPLSKGLFHKAIIQSGSVFNPWAFMENARDRAFELGKILGCETDETTKLLKFFRGIPASDMITAQVKIINETDTLRGFNRPFVPAVEFPARETSFLTQSPRELLQKGQFHKVPLIIGSTSREGMLYLFMMTFNDELFETYNSHFEVLLPHNLGRADSSCKDHPAVQKIKQYFFGNKTISWETLDELLQLFGDIRFNIGIDEAVMLHVNNSQERVYCYEVTYESNYSFLKEYIRKVMYNRKVKGVGHGDEIFLLFSHTLEEIPKLESNSTTEKVVEKFTKMWASFAKTGNPNYTGIETQWEPATEDKYCYLDINDKLQLINGRAQGDRMEFWQQLYNLYPHCF